MDYFYHTQAAGPVRFLRSGSLWIALAVAATYCAAGADLQVLPEYLRPDPFGGIVAADLAPGSGAPPSPVLRGARGSYVSFHLVAKLPEPGSYSLHLALSDPSGKLQVEAYREWFHLTDSDQHYYPDALAPIRLPYRSRLPEPDNRIARQTAQAFWIDLWIPRDVRPGAYRMEAHLTAGAAPAVTLPLELRVLPAVVPNEDVVTIDHNSYGTSWLADQYPKARATAAGDFFRSDALFRLIHAYHRIFYENRGIFHQLGYGHGGKVGPEFAPAIEGSGRNKHITNWELYDRHYGPLFDGSAFAGTRRGPQPIPFAYLPINPEWPASYLWWGEPGYQAEFVNIVSAMERHFREKGWTRTRLEMFFNHKKRYMGFSWDGDETRFPKDEAYFREFGRLLKLAVPADSPVRFVFRADVSWSMERQFRTLGGILNMWVASGGILSWYPEAPAMLHQRGDILWYYSGPPSVTHSAATITRFPFQAWLWGVDGYIHWLTVDAGRDPWFHFGGGETALVYPGERFGVEGPIPSVRLKIQRNAIADLALLSSFQKKRPLAELKTEAARRFNQSRPEDWWNARPAFADRSPEEWSGTDIDEATRKTDRMLAHIAPQSWQNVREFLLDLAGEEQ
jgi:hypothetical protein